DAGLCRRRVPGDGGQARRARGRGSRRRGRRRAVQLRRGQPARLHRGEDVAVEHRVGHRPDLHAHPGADGDDRGGPGLRLRRALRARHRRLRTAGHRGLPRPEVRRAGGPHPRDRRDLPPGVASREARVRRQALHGAAARGPGHGAGQAAQADQPPGARPDPGHARRAGPEERRARRRAGRGVGADLVPPRQGAGGLGRVPGRREGEAGPGAGRARGRGRRPVRGRPRRGQAARARPPAARALRRRHGLQGPELLREARRPLRLRRRGVGDPGPLPLRPQGGGGGEGARGAGARRVAHRQRGRGRRAGPRARRRRRHAAQHPAAGPRPRVGDVVAGDAEVAAV
ncbi:MAG: N5,N10-methylenetetrahydromethanopterin reductase-related protein, partial [uncultured Actinomycetospora sp.]